MRSDSESFDRTAQLTHPNVVQVLDCGRFRNTFILAMEFVEGLSLHQLLRRGALKPAAVAYLGAELTKALEYIHEKRAPDGTWLRLVHRDLNPPNILLSRIGEVKLSDFGVAFATVRRSVNEQGTFYGKEEYAAPEQLAGALIDGRADLFALGITLQEALTRKRARFAVDELRTVPAPLAQIVETLLRPEVVHRPRSAHEVHQRICALPPELAPYPAGERELTESVRACLGEARHTEPLTPQALTETATVRARRSA